MSDRRPTSSLERQRRLAEDTPRGGAFQRLVRNAHFRRLWSAQFVSSIGDWLVIGLLIPLVTRLSGGSSFAVAGIMIAKILPALVLSSFTGVLVDRFDRKKVMIAADVTRAVLSAVLLVTNSLAAIYLIVLLMETMSLFFYPARNSLIPQLLDDEDDIAAANGLAYATQQGAMLVGLTASSAIIAALEAVVRYVLAANLPIVSMMVGLAAPALIGPRAGFVVNTFTFVFSAVVVATIPVQAKADVEHQPLTARLLGRDAIDSFRFLRQHEELRGLLTTIFMALLGGGSIISVGLVFVAGLAGGIPFTDRFPELARLAAAPETFILVFLALGMLVGALLAPRLERHMSLQLMFAGSVTAFGVGLLMFSVATRYWEAGILAIAAGGAVAMVTVAGNTYVVRTVDDEIRGRVFTALESVIRVAMLISMSVMAPLGDAVAWVIRRAEVALGGTTPAFGPPTGVRVTLFLAGVIVLSAAVYAWRTLTWRTIDTEPAKEPGDL